METLYKFSDFLCFVIYKVGRYRRGTVRENLRRALPEMGDEERRKVEREFYRHFADYITETVKLAGITQQELLQHARLVNPEMVIPLLKQDRNCVVLLMGHYVNWEWFTGFQSQFQSKVQVYQIYRTLSNQCFDKLFVFLRTRFGAKGIKKNYTVRDIIKIIQQKNNSLIVFIADQSPSKNNLNLRMNFLHQDSAVIDGPEKIARKFNLPVVFADVTKTARGKYNVEFQLITDQPNQYPYGWITQQYVNKMENCINRNPAYWLWTHKRWKYTKN
jgi:KDO2-lipid IV(A) lauroyltransferase